MINIDKEWVKRVINVDNKWLKRGVIVLIVVVMLFLLWQILKPKGLGDDFASSNGRIEATEIDVAAKIAGRIDKIFVNEGDLVNPGQIVAVMDLKTLKAQLDQAKAELSQAESEIAIAQSTVAQRESEQAADLAVVKQREAELNVAIKRLARSRTLSKEGAAAVQEYDNDLASKQSSAAAVAAARAQVAAAQAAIITAQSQVVGARAKADAARAEIVRIQSDIDDSELKSPAFGRVQYRIAQPGEVISAGGRVLNLIDFNDIYMMFFLPTDQAGRVSIGADARIVLDAMPQFVIPAKISYVADVAQFTPKTVETAQERQKLTFRVKARIDPALLRKYFHSVKTGLPGMAYVRLNPKAKWPAQLEPGLIQ